mmetsp:Transcript_153472/g.490602  ORF Transcript_153472/g.490602 Transcript_153472/m.490602 type:complete len:395 (-) Transcript_153472:53-1237(-)
MAGRSDDSLDVLLDLAIRAVAFASRVSVAVQAKHRGAGAAAWSAKGDASPVTVGDWAVQCLIVEFLSVATGVGSDLRLMGEEDADLLKDGSRDAELQEVVALLNEHFPFAEAARLDRRAGARGVPRGRFTEPDVIALLQRGSDAGGREGRFWVLDPIDGTKGFIRDAQYAIGLGLVERGSPVLGVIGSPNLPGPGGDVTRRAEGEGWVFAGLGDWAGAIELGDCLRRCGGDAPSGDAAAWREAFGRLQVAPCAAAEAVMCESFELSHRDGDEIRPRSELLSAMADRRLDSMSKYGLVARGDAHIYLRGGSMPNKRPENLWDHCPGIPIVLAAGGRATDLRGRPLDFGLGRYLTENHGILATNGTLHAEILAEIAWVSEMATSDGGAADKKKRMA